MEERNGSWASPYLFNAKELDEETGLYYYGARYLNPSITLWLSTDPLQGKYPGMSPYNYCAGNPVKLVDPDGRDIDNSVQDEWNRMFEKLKNRISVVEQGISSTKEKLSSIESGSKKYKDLNRQISTDENTLFLLKQKQADMIAMQNDHSQVYSMRRIEGLVGYISMETDILFINYCNDNNFFHESTHATQYMRGDMGFVCGANPILGFVFKELQDEFCAYSMEYAYSGTLTPDFSLDDVKSMFTLENNKRYYLYKDFPIVSIGKNTDAFLLRIAYPKSKGMHGVNPGSGIKVGNYINNVKFHP